MATHIIGIKVTERQQEALKVQELLTEYGCIIKTRLGMHVAGNASCNESGLILIELTEQAGQKSELEDKLRSLSGVQVKTMSFE